MYKSFLVLLFFILSNIAKAQSIKGLYINGFSTILGNTQKEDSLLLFAKNNGFNYLTLYQMHIVNANAPLNNASACSTFTNFVRKAKIQFGILQIGVAGENYNFFANNIFPYNQQHPLASEKIDVYNLEFEFWVPSSINAGGEYCVDYLTNAGYTCDSAGAFTYYQKMLSRTDSLANADGAISETYFGWFSATEGTQIIQSGIDRILLSVYLPSANYSNSYQYNYIKSRLQYLGNNNTTVKILPIYSAEPSFMQTWANANPFFQPYTDLQNSLLAESASWKNFIQVEGIQWFAYTDMPLKNMTLPIQNLKEQCINIFINPVQQTICCTTSLMQSAIKIYNSMGQIIFVKYNCSELEIISTSNFKSGIYILEVQNKESIIRKKILIS